MILDMKKETTKTLEELYVKLLPALRTKKKEMQQEKMLGINEEDIWFYMCKKVWNGRNSLTLGEMVNDILNIENFTIYMSLKGE